MFTTLYDISVRFEDAVRQTTTTEFPKQPLNHLHFQAIVLRATAGKADSKALRVPSSEREMRTCTRLMILKLTIL